MDTEKKSLNLFWRITQEGFAPDKVTLVGVLCACTHAVLIEEGLEYFYSMEKEYGVIPLVEHYGCMMEAFDLVHSMSMEPNTIIWGTLLGACRMHKASDYAKEALEQLVEPEPGDAGNYSLLSNIYAAEGEWDSVASVRLQMKNTGTLKPSGASSIELDDSVHEFTVRDRSHPQSKHIFETIDGLGLHLKQVGFVQKAGC